MNIKLNEIVDASIEITEIENYFINASEAKASNNSNIATTNNNTTHKGIFTLDKMQLNLKNMVRVHFIWKNYEEKNDKDTEIGTTNGRVIRIPIETNFKQYTGGEL